jgi:hypothetical protein
MRDERIISGKIRANVKTDEPPMPTIDIQPIEINGGHYVAINMGGRELRRHGPYADADAAKATVDRLVRQWLTTLPIHVTTNDALINNHDFIVDCCRFSEGLFSEKDVKKKYRFDNATWEKLGEDEALIEAIEAEKVRRTRSGATARERAQVLFTTTPTVLGNILNDGNISPRHKIEAAREIRAVAATGPETQPTMDRFQITINLGADEVIHLNKPIAVGVDDDGKIIDDSRLLTGRREDD